MVLARVRSGKDVGMSFNLGVPNEAWERFGPQLRELKAYGWESDGIIWTKPGEHLYGGFDAAYARLVEKRCEESRQAGGDMLSAEKQNELRNELTVILLASGLALEVCRDERDRALLVNIQMAGTRINTLLKEG
jgi:signal transduction histidine kinase